MALRNDDPRRCPGSGRMGDYQRCPVCHRTVSTKIIGNANYVPTHLPPKGGAAEAEAFGAQQRPL